MEASKRPHVMTVTPSINALVEYSAEAASYNTYHEADSLMEIAITSASSPSM